MQTVNFTCGHCGNLMAVSQEFLGQQVRCPHCQQVVLAPAPAAPPPPPAAGGLQETTFSVPPLGESESIFSPPDVSDDLFGGPPPSHVEMPPEPAAVPSQWPSLDLSAPTEQLAAPPPTPTEPTLTLTQPEPAPVLEPVPPAPAPTGDWMTAAPQAPAEPDAGLSALPSPAQVRRRSRSSGWFIALVMIPLVSYAIFATIAIIWLLILLNTPRLPPHPLEMVPDLEGDNPGARRDKSSRLEINLPSATLEVPAHLRTSLGEPIRVGDIEVTPQKIELRRVWISTPGFNPTEGSDDSLVLYLHLSNLSADVTFKPMDPYFDRRWKARKATPSQTVHRPYTLLEVVQPGKDPQFFFGGPVPWTPPGKTPPARESVFLRNEGAEVKQHYSKELKPGESMDTFVCTDYEDHVARTLASHRGPLLWRVQVRRGLVRYRDRDISTTAVIGVEFTEQDIRKPG